MVGRAGLHYSIFFSFSISSAWSLRNGEASGIARESMGGRAKVKAET